MAAVEVPVEVPLAAAAAEVPWAVAPVEVPLAVAPVEVLLTSASASAEKMATGAEISVTLSLIGVPQHRPL